MHVYVYVFVFVYVCVMCVCVYVCVRKQTSVESTNDVRRKLPYE